MIDKVEALLREAAQRAILPRFQRLQCHEVEEKSPGELVTAADRDAEHIISAGLKALSPAALIVGEEAAAADPALLSQVLGADEVWVIDPLDGTAHFAAGRELFAVMVALVRKGEIVLSCIFEPVAGTIRVAERGAGAYADGKRVRAVDGCPPPGAIRGAILKRFISPADRARIEPRESMIGAVLPGLMCAGRDIRPSSPASSISRCSSACCRGITRLACCSRRRRAPRRGGSTARPMCPATCGPGCWWRRTLRYGNACAKPFWPICRRMG
jgi:hypothetical protein